MKLLKSICVGSLVGVLSSTAWAGTGAKLEGVYTDWSVYSKKDGKDKICYVLSKAKSKTPKSVNHGDIYFMVANWKSGAAKEQPSLLTGYTIKPEIPPAAIVGGSKVPMFASANEAFVESPKDEKKLVRNMRKGSMMRVDAVSARGTQTSYEFSLKGVTAALSKAKAACR